MADSENSLSTVQGWLESAISFVDTDISPERKTAAEYYKGKPFGNEEDGRSKVVVHAVRTAVKKVMPSLLRVFFGSEQVVEFVPRTENDVPLADQQNDLLRVVVEIDNPGFRVFHAWFKDALIKRMGVVKYWWETKEEVTAEEYKELAPEVAQQLLLQNKQVRNPSDMRVDIQPNEDGTVNMRIEYIFKDEKACFDVVPPEEFVWNQTARSLDDAYMVAHRSEKTLGDLVAMGFDRKVLEELDYSVSATQGTDNPEAWERQDGQQSIGFKDAEPASPWANRKTNYAEVYARIDEDGDGIPELRLYRLAGSSWTHLDDESMIVDEMPFAILVPDPEPHTITGLGLADDTMDLQLIQSNILRGILDSLNLTLNPATEAVVGQVNMQDLNNPEVGKVIRVKAPGMVREVKHTFVGADALPIMQYFDNMADKRTGLPDASAGLDADALQSSTASAVNATVQGAQQQIELIARIFAETGVKQLFRGLSRLMAKYQTQARVIRLRDTYVSVDPTVWARDLDLRVNVALGSGLVEQKIAVLTGTAATQMQILAAQPSNPIVSMRQLSFTLRKALELSGFKNSSDFFSLPTPEEEQKLLEQMSQQPDPQAQAIQAQLQIEQAKLEVQKQKAESDQAIKQMEFQFNTQLEQAKLDAEREKAALRAEYDFRAEQMKLQFEREKFEREMELEYAKLGVQKDVELEKEGMKQSAETHREKIRAEAQPITVNVAENKPEKKRKRKRSFTLAKDAKGVTIGGTIEDHDED